MITYNEEDNTLYINGAIEGASFFSSADSETVFELSKYDTTRALEVVINSPGGSANEGLAIKCFLESLAIAPNITVTGLAASAATLITSAKNAHVTMKQGSMMMIHEPWVTTQGSKDELIKAAQVLDKRSQSMAEIYAEKTGLSVRQITKMMKDETWLSASEAVDMGFADAVDTSVEVYASLDKNVLSIGGLDFNCESYSRIKDFFNCHNLQEEQNKMTQANKTKADDKALTETRTVQSVSFADSASLIKAYPDLCRQIADKAFSEGQRAERERIQELDALASTEHADIIAKAKYETFEDAKSCAYNIVKAQKAMLEEQSSALRTDAAALTEITTAQDDVMASADAERTKIINSVLENM